MFYKLLLAIITILTGIYLYQLQNYDVKLENVKGKRVLITGASTGIGEALAYKYAALGAKVMVTARRENLLQKVVTKCQQLGGNPKNYYQYVTADMGDYDTSSSHVIKTMVDTFGGVDILVLNHIWPQQLDYWKYSQQNLTTVEKLMNINFLSYVHLATHAMPHLEKSSGQIVVISSLSIFLQGAFLAPYVATKAAVAAFFKTLINENEVSGSQVAITLCHLGYIETESAIANMNNSPYKDMNIRGSSPSDTADAIVKSTSHKQTELIYSNFLGHVCFYFPDLIWKITKNILKP